MHPHCFCRRARRRSTTAIPGGARADAEAAQVATTTAALRGYGLHVVHDGLLAGGGDLTVELLNARDASVTINLDVTLIDGKGIHAHKEIEQATVEPGERRRVSIPARLLALPSGEGPAPGRLFVTSRGFFDDGVIIGAAAPELYYQRVASGWALTADEEQLLAATGIPREALNEARVFDTSLYGADPALDGDEGASEAPEPLETPVGSSEPVLRNPIMERMEAESGALVQREHGVVADKAVVTANFCLKQVSTYLDAGMGEDNWTSSNPTARDTIGQDVSIHRWLCNSAGSNCQWYFSAWTSLGDGYVAGKTRGCTGPVSLSTGDIRLTVYSTGIINGNYLWASPTNSFDEADLSQFTYNLTSGGTKTLTFTPNQNGMLNVYMAAAQAMRVVGGINKTGGPQYYTHMRSTTSQSHRLVYDDMIFLLAQHYQDKHEITHAVGHHIQFRATGNNLAYDCTDTGGGGVCMSPSGQNRAFSSREWQSCALYEGYANFYGSLAWNDTAESDCVTTWANDCAGGTDDVPLRFMEQSCRAPYPDNPEIQDEFLTRSTEIDWQRALWQVLTDGSGDPSHNDVLRWIRDADDGTAWTRDNSFTLLNYAANDIGGVINTRFDAAKTRHGIDHHRHHNP